LLELGFISNANDYAYLSSADGQEKIAQRLFEAFKAYKTQYDASITVDEAPESTPVPTAEKVSTSSKWYGIQIMGLSRKLSASDPALKGLKAEAVKADGSNIYKYVTGKSETKEAAASKLSEVRKKFPEAFLVEVEGNNVIRSK
jgi:N-acetylmuramoyl-L-alanine amidase